MIKFETPKADCIVEEIKTIPNDHDIFVSNPHEVLCYLNNRHGFTPKVVAYNPDHKHLVREYVKGLTLEQVYGISDAIPNSVISQIAEAMKELHSDANEEGVIKSFRRDNFYCDLKFFYQTVTQRYLAKEPKLFENLGIDKHLIGRVFSFTDRVNNTGSKSICHGDLHRRNILLDKAGDVKIIDWESAIFGDPRFDIAVHLFKCKYDKSAEVEFIEAYYGVDYVKEDYEAIQEYKKIIALKEVVVDAVHVVRERDTNKAKKLILKLRILYDMLNIEGKSNEEILSLLH